MLFVYDDGGRKAAGYKGTTGDCACRAVAPDCDIDKTVYYDDEESFVGHTEV